MLRNGKDQAFYGAPLVEFPPLGEHYVRWFIGHLERADAGDPARALGTFVEREIERVETETLDELHALTPLQSAVIREMAARGRRFAPFEAATMTRYAATLAALDPDGTLVPNTPNVQSALGALQEAGLVWRAGRGVYAIEDERLVALMRREGMVAED